jgi:hypothetical protein
MCSVAQGYAWQIERSEKWGQGLQTFLVPAVRTHRGYEHAPEGVRAEPAAAEESMLLKVYVLNPQSQQLGMARLHACLRARESFSSPSVVQLLALGESSAAGGPLQLRGAKHHVAWFSMELLTRPFQLDGSTPGVFGGGAGASDEDAGGGGVEAAHSLARGAALSARKSESTAIKVRSSSAIADLT